MPVDHFCLTCSKTFASIGGLQSHARAKGHTANPFVCEDCDVSFATDNALDSHMNSPRHADTYADLYEDIESEFEFYASSESNDGGDPYCSGCERQFVDMGALNQHLFNSSKHNWCFDCSRDFASDNSLLQHQNSLAHSGRDFKCPFCNGMFKSPSGIALHIESGCHKVTRHQVTAAVHNLRIIPNISLKRITGPVQPPSTSTTYIASEASFDGSSYACFLCSKKCRTLAGLNSHLNSPAHDDDEFKCPKCKRQFALISGFVQHLESRACGFARASEITDRFADLTGQFSRLLKI